MEHKLRNYQTRIHEATWTFLTEPGRGRVGQIYSPTGSGKTVCFEKAILKYSQLALAVAGKHLKIAVVHPRIALSQDQLRRFKRTFGTGFSYSSFHSGEHLRGEEEVIEVSTTDRDELVKIIDETITSNTHITFSTYHSFHKIQDIEFDLVIFDEGHNLTKNDFYPIMAAVQGKKILVYTATPVIAQDLEESGGDLPGMNNFMMFGEILIKIEPKELIKSGYIVGPVVQLLRCSTKDGGEYDIVDLLSRVWNAQYAEITAHGMPFHQMFVTSKSCLQHKEVEGRLGELWSLIGQQVDVYVIEAGSHRKNGVQVACTRSELLNQVKMSNNAIVMHYDTLAEGIDIDTLTGALILRDVKRYKLLQIIGRCGRPFKDDLTENGEVRSMTERKKPASVLTIPVINGKFECGADAGQIARYFISGGYDDLATSVKFIDDPELPRGKDTDDTPGPTWGEDNAQIMSQIVEASLERDAGELEKLGIFI
jgi:hypothetical protein